MIWNGNESVVHFVPFSPTKSTWNLPSSVNIYIIAILYIHEVLFLFFRIPLPCTSSCTLSVWVCVAKQGKDDILFYGQWKEITLYISSFQVRYTTGKCVAFWCSKYDIASPIALLYQIHLSQQHTHRVCEWIFQLHLLENNFFVYVNAQTDDLYYIVLYFLPWIIDFVYMVAQVIKEINVI